MERVTNLALLNTIRARQVLDTLVILAEREHVESLSMTSREVREKKEIYVPLLV